MSLVLQEIVEWAAKSLKYWEQAILDEIIAGKTLSDEDYDRFLQFLLEDNGLLEKTPERPQLAFLQNITTDQPPTTHHIKLRSLYGVTGVNALVEGQRLEFSDQMTVIYGLNGSGKSGYARVLGCAGFTRGDKEILKDILRQPDNQNTTSAQIEIEDNNGTRILSFSGENLPEIRHFYMFDSTSVDIHLTTPTELTFSPFGLSYLKQLVAAADETREHLKSLVDNYRQPHQFHLLFQGDTPVSKIINALNTSTDVASLKQLANLSDEEENSIIDLDREIAQLKAQDVSEKIEAIDQSINDIDELRSHLDTVSIGLNDEVITLVQDTLREYSGLQETIRSAGLDQFTQTGFTQTGTPVWLEFVQAAYNLGQSESNSYPRQGEKCLLCGQILSDSSLNHIRSLWEFLKIGAQTKLQEVESKIESLKEDIKSLDTDFLNEETVYYRFLVEDYPLVLNSIQSYLTTIQGRQSQLLEMLDLQQPTSPFDTLPTDVIPSLEDIKNNLTNERTQLNAVDISKRIAELEQQLLELQHRDILNQNITKIEEYINSVKWADKASKSGGNSAKITQKHNELFDKYVTAEFVTKFEATLKRLGRPLKVRLGTTGRKGQTYRQVVLQTRDDSIRVEAKPNRVLSEGEKRAVAIADFLTEVNLDPHSCGIILDDPVTSLDLEWRASIAQLIVEEAVNRQVIVFTHDLPFLHHLQTCAEEKAIRTEWHHIRRGDDDLPGYVYLKNSPALEKDYKGTKMARDWYKKAKDNHDNPREQLDHLRQGFGALRTSYESLIVYDLFGEVVRRFTDRISVERLKNVIVTREISQEIITRYGFVSRHIEGHLHSDVTPTELPTLTLLDSEIKAYEALLNKLKALKNA